MPRGGARKGAGRPKAYSKRMYIPQPLIKKVEEMIEELRAGGKPKTGVKKIMKKRLDIKKR